MSWLLAFAGFAVLIILHELGHFAAAKWVGMRVERFSLFFPPYVWERRRGETVYSVGSIPLGGFVKITGMSPEEDLDEEVARRAYLKQPVWKRVVVIFAGPLVNIVLAFLILWALFLSQGQATGVKPEVASIERGSPAAEVLREGDVLLAVDGVRGSTDRLQQQIRTHRCAGGSTVDSCAAAEPAELLVRRDGREVTVKATPFYDAELKRPRLGFGFGTQYESIGPVDAAGESVSGMWRVTTASVEAITGVFYSSQKREEVSGIVGSYETTRQVIRQSDWVLVAQILALISLSLAVVNLFPFLPLDGGHIFWAVAEKVRGRPIPFRLMERASVVGFLLVAFLFVVGLSNDIDRLANEGFGPR